MGNILMLVFLIFSILFSSTRQAVFEDLIDENDNILYRDKTYFELFLYLPGTIIVLGLSYVLYFIIKLLFLDKLCKFLNKKPFEK